MDVGVADMYWSQCVPVGEEERRGQEVIDVYSLCCSNLAEKTAAQSHTHTHTHTHTHPSPSSSSESLLETDSAHVICHRNRPHMIRDMASIMASDGYYTL